MHDITTKSSKRFANQYCKNNAAKQQLINDLNCVSDDEHHIIKRIADEVTLGVEMALNEDFARLIPIVCCHYKLMQYRIVDTVKQVCNEKSIQMDNYEDHFYAKLLPALLGETLDLVCTNKYDSISSCEENLAEYPKLFTTINATTLPEIEYSVTKAALDFISRLD